MASPHKKPTPLPDSTVEILHDDAEGTFERKLLNDLPHLKARLGDIRMYRAFRREFAHIRKEDPKNLHFYVVYPENDIALTRAFGLENNAENVTFLHKTRAEKNAFELRGYRGEKGIAHWHEEAEKADVMVVMDEDVKITLYLLRNLVPGGLILMPMAHANALRANGRYECKGIIERHGTMARVNKSIGPDFWENSEVDTEEEFKRASSKEGIEGTVTYEEAVKTLEAAGRKVDKDNVLRDYKKLIEDARAQKRTPGSTETMVRFVAKINDIDTIVPVKIILPLAEREYKSERYAIFYKQLS